jgi:hypothetical protein
MFKPTSLLRIERMRALWSSIAAMRQASTFKSVTGGEFWSVWGLARPKRWQRWPTTLPRKPRSLAVGVTAALRAT